MGRFWGVRLGEGGEYIDFCYSKGIVAVGWNELGDLSWISHESPDNAREKLRKLLKKKYVQSKMQRAMDVAQICPFVRDIKMKDIVLSPDPRSRTVLIGKVSSNYFRAQGRDACRYKQRRKVEWITKINRDDMSQPLRNSLGALLTVFEIKKHDTEIESLVIGKPYLKTLRKVYATKEKEESIVGETINFRGLIYSPINEQGVVFLFSKITKDLGIEIEEIKNRFPDAIGRVKTTSGFARRTIEFEYKSSGYDHPEKCDILVCWEHDWKDCPSETEVIELKSVIKGLSPKEG